MFEETIINRRSALPRHAQIETYLRDLIVSGRLAPGERIPAEVEIARTLGVSRMTVNKAILALAREGLFQRDRGLGTFVACPDSLAPRQLTVTLPLDYRTEGDEQDCYFGPLCRAIQAAAEARQYRVTLSYLPDGDYAASQRRWPVDGWLLISPDRARLEDVRALRRTGSPVVVIGARWQELAEIPSVDSDNIGGSLTAIRYLVGLGHRRIALVYAGPDSSNTMDRLAGYRQALREADITPRSEWEIQGDSAERLGEGAAALQALLSLEADQRPTAIFAAGYYLALETLNIAREQGLSVPESLSVVGYDDPSAAQLAYPPLTTLRQPLAEMGQAAVDLLDRQIRRLPFETGSSLHLLPPRLQARGSAARLPSPARLLSAPCSDDAARPHSCSSLTF